MTWPAPTLQGGKRTAHVLVYISIKAAKAGQEPATTREISKKYSEKQKITSGEDRKKFGEMTKNYKTKHPKEIKSGPLRGVRKKRKRQRKRVTFTTSKQSLPPFFLFMAKHRPELQKSNPHWTVVKTVTKLGKMWHKQPEKDKEMYKEQAAWLRRKNKGKKHRSRQKPGKARKRAYSRKKTQAKRRKLRL